MARSRRIGDLAKAAGVGVETVRFYEREGLIEQPPKPSRGWRHYGKQHWRQLSTVKLAQEQGLTLADVKRLQKKRGGPQPAFCAEVRETVTARLADIERQIAALTAKRKALSGWLKLCVAREGSGDCPLYSQLQRTLPAKRPKPK